MRTKQGKRDEIAEFYKVGKLLFHLLRRLMPCVQMSSGPRDQNPIYTNARRGDQIAHKVNSTLANKLDTPGKEICNKKDKSFATRTNWPRKVRELILDSDSWSQGVKGYAFRVPGGQRVGFHSLRGSRGRPRGS